MRNSILLLAVVCTLSACKGDEKKKAGGGPVQATCRAAQAEDFPQGECRIRLVSPAPCTTVDLRNGKTADFTWTTDGTNCSLPFKALLAGNPITRNEDNSLNNVHGIDLRNGEGLENETTFSISASARDFDGLTSTDGTFDWSIADRAGSHPPSRVVRVLK